jgi:hypothetical protein
MLRRQIVRFRGPKGLKVDAWYPSGLDNFLVAFQSRQRFDVVVAEYIFLSRALTAFDSTVHKVLDTHDAFSLRTEELYRQGRLEWCWFPVRRAEERKGLQRADAILGIQAKECGYFRQLVHHPVFEVGHLYDIAPPAPEPAEPVCLFVGSSGTGINLQAVTWYAEQVFPLVRAALADAEFWVAGGICGDFANTQAGVRKLGYVSDLKEVYRQAAVVVNPVQMGSGLPIKSIEALAAGRPLVASPSGARGLTTGAGSSFLVADGAAEFANAVIGLMKNPDRRAALAASARTFAEQRNRENLERLQAAIACPKGENGSTKGDRRVP